MIRVIRKSRFAKFVAVFVALNLILSIVEPMRALALTGGPSQPEVESFEPVGTTDMVDIFSGDFVYNIPLLEVENYPINISYHSGVTMDQEASWVGLGWSLNPGAINRNMRGLPDDFNGDLIKKDYNIKDNVTYGVNTGVGVEIFGLSTVSPTLTMGLGISHNNYVGVTVEKTYGAYFSIGQSGSSQLTANLGFNVTTSTDDGVSLSPSVSLQTKMFRTNSLDMGIGSNLGCTFNSRQGLKSLTIGVGPSASLRVGTGSFSPHLPSSTATINFSTPTYIPNITMPMVTSSTSFGTKLGGELFGTDMTADLGGFMTTNYLEDQDKHTEIEAYGYMYSHNNDDNDLLDFNREKDIPFSLHTPNLPVTNFTYDAYSVTGQGVGGMIRPFRNDVGYMYDHRLETRSGSDDINLEASIGNYLHGGAQYDHNEILTTCNPWEDNNNVASTLKFKASSGSYPPYTFKQIGEYTIMNSPDLFEKSGSYEPAMIPLTDLDNDDYDVIAENKFKDYYGTERSAVGTRLKYNRNNDIIILTKEEVENGFGLQDYVSNYAENHHIGEITVIQPDGTRYVYGIPAYNILQKEVTFSVEGSDNGTGLIAYDDTDASVNNNKGRDNYYSSIETPPYAHSYMLTAVLSADYVDSDDIQGPSWGDLGTYTIFEYEQTLTQDGNNDTLNYKWRVPCESYMANYNEGLKSDDMDDKASYVYGEKEMFYLARIKTRTRVAEFTTISREDAYGVSGEHGGVATSNGYMKRLDKISLYAYPEWKLENTPGSGYQATPIKEVHFVFDGENAYDLCRDVPNNILTQTPPAGKLTLKGIYFTYGNSKKGMLTPYKFHYWDPAVGDNTTENPYYDIKAYDRWGNYKPNFLPAQNSISNAEYPYVLQGDQTTADQYSTAWSLRAIDLPSGGRIEVELEADDYAYVQDRKAMQMYGITAINNSGAFPIAFPNDPINDLYGSGGNNNYLFFDLQPGSVDINTTHAEFEDMYLGDILNSYDSLVYFKCLVNTTLNDPEYITGYAKIINSDFDYNNNRGWIELQAVEKGGGIAPGTYVNPISKAAWQFSRLNTPRKANTSLTCSSCDNGSGIHSIMAELVSPSLIDAALEIINGVHGQMQLANFGKMVHLDKSWIRLMNPVGQKYGGGARVSRLLVYDSWMYMTEQEHKMFGYGQEYDYTTTDEVTGKTISSGVASYEPMIGGEENPVRQPVFFSVDKLLVPNDEYYMEEPFGESFFPAPSVGYSKVTVSNMTREERTAAQTYFSPIERPSNTGIAVHEFFTAKDYPVHVKHTPIITIPKKTSLLEQFLQLDFSNLKTHMNVSQGYVVELNDMHGKSKRQTIYAEGQTEPISKIEYYYKHIGNRLNNTVTTISKSGEKYSNEIGVDYDVVADFREHMTTTETMGIHGNFSSFFVTPFPAPITVPTAWPNYFYSEQRFRSAVVTKVINRYGILSKVRTDNFGSSITQKNLAYDSSTGDVILTETINNYDDPVYTFTYPAHWAYDRMDRSCRNSGMKKSVYVYSNGTFTNAGGFALGDRVALSNSNGNIWGWVSKNSSGNLIMIDKYGNYVPVNENYTARVIRSGRRNQQNIPVGTFTSFVNPLIDDVDATNTAPGNGILDFAELSSYAGLKILNAEAIEFTENAKLYCECDVVLEEGVPFNPYVLGAKGNWRPLRTHAYLTSRLQEDFISNPNNNLYLRKDGTFDEYEPFWMVNGYNDWTINTSSKWQFANEVTIYSTYGFELENMDALERFSSAQYGYNNVLPVGVTSNSMYQEMGVDNFEEYEFDDCSRDHFSFEEFIETADPSGVTVTFDQSHTGRRSVRIGSGYYIQLVRPIYEECD